MPPGPWQLVMPISHRVRQQHPEFVTEAIVVHARAPASPPEPGNAFPQHGRHAIVSHPKWGLPLVPDVHGPT
ncbi:MAG: hypothetical protein JWR13_4049 [Mycobacterium sp.]|jgi:hypothetical protein|nr:hypothetical protein [Mycobacterium sp.]